MSAAPRSSGHVQRKYPRINHHRTRTLMASQHLNHFLRLAVIEHVHDVAVTERMWRHRNGIINTVFSGPLHRLLQPVAHRIIGDVPQ